MHGHMKVKLHDVIYKRLASS